MEEQGENTIRESHRLKNMKGRAGIPWIWGSKIR